MHIQGGQHKSGERTLHGWGQRGHREVATTADLWVLSSKDYRVTHHMKLRTTSSGEQVLRTITC